MFIAKQIMLRSEHFIKCSIFHRKMAQLNKFLMNNCFSETKKMNKIRTFIFMDLETTGLPRFGKYCTKITEICLVAVHADHLELGVFPRVQNKLSLCFNPAKMIDDVAADLTGLSNELLEHQSQFNQNTVNTINSFLDANQKPICLIAHNGDRFDFPILNAELNRSNGSLIPNILCIDSLKAFKALENEVNNSGNKTEELRKENNAIVFEDDYDQLLMETAEKVEQSFSQKKMSVEDVQKINETTPKKNMINSSGSCIDTNRDQIPIIKTKLNFKSPRKSYKLVDVYQRLICKEPKNSHNAEGDTIMLLTCAASFAERFVEYANNNAKSFEKF